MIAFAGKSQTPCYHYPVTPGPAYYSYYSSYVIGSIPGYANKKSARYLKKLMQSPEIKAQLAQMNSVDKQNALRVVDSVLNTYSK